KGNQMNRKWGKPSGLHPVQPAPSPLSLSLSRQSFLLTVLNPFVGTDQPIVKQSTGELSIRESPTCLVPRTPPQGPKACPVQPWCGKCRPLWGAWGTTLCVCVCE